METFSAPVFERVLDRIGEPYQASLDGNEQYEDVEGVLTLWRAMRAEPRLKRLVASVVFIEQPIKRQNALPFIEAQSAKVLATAEEQFDVTRARIGQIEAKALMKLLTAEKPVIIAEYVGRAPNALSKR